MANKKINTGAIATSVNEPSRPKLTSDIIADYLKLMGGEATLVKPDGSQYNPNRKGRVSIGDRMTTAERFGQAADVGLSNEFQKLPEVHARFDDRQVALQAQKELATGRLTTQKFYETPDKAIADQAADEIRRSDGLLGRGESVEVRKLGKAYEVVAVKQYQAVPSRGNSAVRSYGLDNDPEGRYVAFNKPEEAYAAPKSLKELQAEARQLEASGGKALAPDTRAEFKPQAQSNWEKLELPARSPMTEQLMQIAPEPRAIASNTARDTGGWANAQGESLVTSANEAQKRIEVAAERSAYAKQKMPFASQRLAEVDRYGVSAPLDDQSAYDLAKRNFETIKRTALDFPDAFQGVDQSAKFPSFSTLKKQAISEGIMLADSGTNAFKAYADAKAAELTGTLKAPESGLPRTARLGQEYISPKSGKVGTVESVGKKGVKLNVDGQAVPVEYQTLEKLKYTGNKDYGFTAPAALRPVFGGFIGGTAGSMAFKQLAKAVGLNEDQQNAAAATGGIVGSFVGSTATNLPLDTKLRVPTAREFATTMMGAPQSRSAGARLFDLASSESGAIQPANPRVMQRQADRLKAKGIDVRLETFNPTQGWMDEYVTEVQKAPQGSKNILAVNAPLDDGSIRKRLVDAADRTGIVVKQADGSIADILPKPNNLELAPNQRLRGTAYVDPKTKAQTIAVDAAFPKFGVDNTIAHEMGHILAGHTDGSRGKLPSTLKELEANAVAYGVAKKLGVAGNPRLQDAYLERYRSHLNMRQYQDYRSQIGNIDSQRVQKAVDAILPYSVESQRLVRGERSQPVAIASEIEGITGDRELTREEFARRFPDKVKEYAPEATPRQSTGAIYEPPASTQPRSLTDLRQQAADFNQRYESGAVPKQAYSGKFAPIEKLTIEQSAASMGMSLKEYRDFQERAYRDFAPKEAPTGTSKKPPKIVKAERIVIDKQTGDRIDMDAYRKASKEWRQSTAAETAPLREAYDQAVKSGDKELQKAALEAIAETEARLPKAPMRSDFATAKPAAPKKSSGGFNRPAQPAQPAQRQSTFIAESAVEAAAKSSGATTGQVKAQIASQRATGQAPDLDRAVAAIAPTQSKELAIAPTQSKELAVRSLKDMQSQSKALSTRVLSRQAADGMIVTPSQSMIDAGMKQQNRVRLGDRIGASGLGILMDTAQAAQVLTESSSRGEKAPVALARAGLSVGAGYATTALASYIPNPYLRTAAQIGGGIAAVVGADKAIDQFVGRDAAKESKFAKDLSKLDLQPVKESDQWKPFANDSNMLAAYGNSLTAQIQSNLDYRPAARSLANLANSQSIANARYASERGQSIDLSQQVGSGRRQMAGQSSTVYRDRGDGVTEAIGRRRAFSDTESRILALQNLANESGYEVPRTGKFDPKLSEALEKLGYGDRQIGDYIQGRSKVIGNPAAKQSNVDQAKQQFALRSKLGKVTSQQMTEALRDERKRQGLKGGQMLDQNTVASTFSSLATGARIATDAIATAGRSLAQMQGKPSFANRTFGKAGFGMK